MAASDTGEAGAASDGGCGRIRDISGHDKKNLVGSSLLSSEILKGMSDIQYIL